MNGCRSPCANEKYLYPWTPPKPHEVEASTNMGNDTAGYLFIMYKNDKPRLRRSTRCQMRNAVRVKGGTAICAVGFSSTINENTHDSRGRQNGSTHAA